MAEEHSGERSARLQDRAPTSPGLKEQLLGPGRPRKPWTHLFVMAMGLLVVASLAVPALMGDERVDVAFTLTLLGLLGAGTGELLPPTRRALTVALRLGGVALALLGIGLRLL
ncbi:hypothetical protein ER308_20425 [Egibacter rhizosphaerae]|uniref:DUF3017 domain-containing protein n=2 Tax=Egibacter rhizosphaerae TaxID=1670831 RepID=A0A411YKF7_9ACTN|nr:hypothetical protein ER308_20425 [Egibacter rhizosphaerae]